MYLRPLLVTRLLTDKLLLTQDIFDECTKPSILAQQIMLIFCICYTTLMHTTNGIFGVRILSKGMIIADNLLIHLFKAISYLTKTARTHYTILFRTCT